MGCSAAWASGPAAHACTLRHYHKASSFLRSTACPLRSRHAKTQELNCPALVLAPSPTKVVAMNLPGSSWATSHSPAPLRLSEAVSPQQLVKPNQCWYQKGLHLPHEGVHWRSSAPRHHSDGPEDALQPTVRLPPDEEPLTRMSLMQGWPPPVEPHVSTKDIKL